MVCRTSGTDRANTRIVCGCVCHKRHCAVDRSVRYIMEAEVISWGRTASCKWCHLHDTSADYLHDAPHDTSANGYRDCGSHPVGAHPRSHIGARYTWAWRSKEHKNSKDGSGSRQIT